MIVIFIYILDDSDNPNEVPETPEKPPKTMKDALKSTSKPSNKNEKNAGAGSLDGSRFYNIFDSTSIIFFFEL